MLSGMRSFAKSKWAIVLLALLALALGVGVGISNPFTGVAGGGFVQAGQHSFGARDANRYLNQYIENVRNETGENVQMEEAARQGVTNQIVGVLMQRASTLAYADKIGVKASPSAVAKIFADAPRFRDALGMIQMTQIESFAYDSSFRDRREFEEFQRDEVTIGYMQQSALASVATPSILIQPLVEFVGERRKISFARLTPESVPEIADPTEDELVAFYDERQSLFQQPERRALSAIVYSPDDYIDLEPITEEMVRSAYETRLRSYTSGETREITEFKANNAGAIQSVVDLVKQGVAIDEALSKASGVTTSKRTVGTSDITQEDYSSLVFGLAVGDVFGPFEVEGQSSGVYLNSIGAGVVRPLEEVAEDLRTDLARQDARRAFNSSSETFYDLVGAGVSLEEIGDELGVPVISVLPIDASGRTEAHGATELMRAIPDALAEAFLLQAGEFTDIVEGEDVRAVVRVDRIVEPRQPELAEVRDDLVEAYRSVKTSEAVSGIVDSAVARINGGEDFDTVARDYDMTTLHPEELATRPMDPNRPNPLLAAAFELGVGVAGVARDQQNGPMLVRVEQVLPVEVGMTSTIEGQVREILDQELEADLQQAYSSALSETIAPKTNNNAINTYLTSFFDDNT